VIVKRRIHPSPTRAQVYQVIDPCYDIGGGAPPISIKVRDPMWCLKSNTSNGIPTYVVMFIKNARFKSQPSTPMLAFASMRSTPFMEIDDKGVESVQRYERFPLGERLHWGER
jgi:hypothetical protein